MTSDSSVEPATAPPSEQRILQPGRTCWRIERARRFALIVDAADYFATVKAAALKARHSIMLIGWDFDTRIRLDPDADETRAPDRLGRFLEWIVARRPELHVYVLKWDLGLVQTLGRGSTPLFIVNWMTSRRIRFELDGQHPAGAVHHQKIIVMDDALAFCGGIDMTADRWDTRGHVDDDPHRVRPSGRGYHPWHDAAAAVDDDVARALGDLARERWRRETGETLDPPPTGLDLWPDGLAPTFEDVDVAIARTMPEYDDRSEVREIEALYLSAIAAARRAIYIESQYFASRRIAEALAERLREPDGPEVVVVNPESADGWLEEAAMGSARARLLKLVGEADRHGRFRIYCPVTERGQPIYVHAKVMTVDDTLLRIGSSNLNNRSMGLDTECDLAVEAVGRASDLEARRVIAGIRNGLLAEHLGVSPDDVAAACDASGSLVRAIESLRGSGRTLNPFVPPKLNVAEEALAETDLLDPERPPKPWRRVRRRVADGLSALRSTRPSSPAG